jgi:dUTP pyrophosphatase
MEPQFLSDKTYRELFTIKQPHTNSVPTVSVFRKEQHTSFTNPRYLMGKGILPERKTTEAYCYDICAYLPEHRSVNLKPLTVTRVSTGLHLALPEHWSALICSRSGLATRGVQVINAPGVIDSDYRDEVSVLLSYIAPPDARPFIVEHNMRIAQLLFLPPTPNVHLTEVPSIDDLPQRDTTRLGGFGSTGASSFLP